MKKEEKSKKRKFITWAIIILAIINEKNPSMCQSTYFETSFCVRTTNCKKCIDSINASSYNRAIKILAKKSDRQRRLAGDSFVCRFILLKKGSVIYGSDQ